MQERSSPLENMNLFVKFYGEDIFAFVKQTEFVPFPDAGEDIHISVRDVQKKEEAGQILHKSDSQLLRWS